MHPTQTSAYHGWKRYSPWPAPTREMPEMNSSTTVVGVFRRPCIPCPQMLQRMKFMTFCCVITKIWKLLPCVYLLLTLSNRYLKSRYRHTMQNTYYELANEGLTITSNGSKVSCIHYTKSLHGKLSEELEWRFNQLPNNLQDAFDRDFPEAHAKLPRWIESHLLPHLPWWCNNLLPDRGGTSGKNACSFWPPSWAWSQTEAFQMWFVQNGD